MSSISRYEAAKELLAAGSLGRAIQLLNKGVPHRFSGIYFLRDGVFHNIVLVDKLGEVTPDHLKSVPLEHSFCQFVMRDNGVDIPDSALDSRLDGHPYQGVMVSYTGVPITDAAGEIVGTLCHFDTMRQNLHAEEYELLWKISRAIGPKHLTAREAV